jgi:hypothetical protein
MAPLNEIIRMICANYHIAIKNGKLAFNIIGIAQPSVFHLHNPNTDNSINEKGSYDQYSPLAENGGFTFKVNISDGSGHQPRKN